MSLGETPGVMMDREAQGIVTMGSRSWHDLQLNWTGTKNVPVSQSFR